MQFSWLILIHSRLHKIPRGLRCRRAAFQIKNQSKQTTMATYPPMLAEECRGRGIFEQQEKIKQCLHQRTRQGV
jgi:hypothetical protein